MSTDFDLFGFPVPEPRDKAGRPEHVPTGENRIKVRLLLAVGRTNGEIAGALGLSQPTLRKHYFQELGERRRARLQLDATRMAMLYAKTLEGDVGANKELGKVLDKYDLAQLDEQVRSRGTGGKDKAEKKVGKKEQQRQDASEVTGKFAPPPPPRMIN